MDDFDAQNSKLKVPQNELEEGKIYTLLNRDENEKRTLPVDPNFAKFYDKGADKDYKKYLFLGKSEDKLSDIVVGKLWVFFIYMGLTCFCYIVFTGLAYSGGSLSYNQMIFHVLSNVLIPVTSSLSLVLLKSPRILIEYIHVIFTCISFIYCSYLILGSRVFLAKLMNEDESEFEIPLNLSIIGFSIILRFLLFHSFFSTLLHNTSIILEYLILTFLTKTYSLNNFCQFFILLIFLILQIIDVKHTELDQKKVFWLQFQYEKSFKTSLSNRFEDCDPSMHTETEILINSLDSVKKTLKQCCLVIIYKDIKDSLKLAQVKLENIKQRLGKGLYLNEVKIEQHENMDPEDKKFIYQNFIDFSHINTPERSAVTELTVFEFKEFPESFPFSHYGIEKLESVLSLFGKNWSFDIWFIHNATGQSVSIIGKYLFQKWQFNDFLSQSSEVTDEFFIKIESGYNKNPYHNACHAADVLHTQLFFIAQSDLAKTLTQLDIVCCIIASCGHDIGHPALTNRFLVNNCDDIAVTYNDFSVLENMHSAKTFSILRSPGYNILENLSNEDWLKSRKMIIEMILETDMSKHFEILGKFRTRVITLSNLDITIFDDKCQVLGMALKCADIGHSAKDYDLHEKWSMMVCEEFFRQGDIEKSRGQAVSMYCDRETTDIPKSQAGFIKNICLPLYEVWAFYLKSETVEKFSLGQLRNNLEFWSQKKKRRSTVKPDDYKMLEKFKRIQTSG
jgi:hypothetical protein